MVISSSDFTQNPLLPEPDLSPQASILPEPHCVITPISIRTALPPQNTLQPEPQCITRTAVSSERHSPQSRSLLRTALSPQNRSLFRIAVSSFYQNCTVSEFFPPPPSELHCLVRTAVPEPHPIRTALSPQNCSLFRTTVS